MADEKGGERIGDIFDRTNPSLGMILGMGSLVSVSELGSETDHYLRHYGPGWPYVVSDERGTVAVQRRQEDLPVEVEHRQSGRRADDMNAGT